MSGKKLKNGCIPARRKISSGGKTGSYASARTGGKQAHSALMQKRPPGSNDGYFKNAVCCHKCPNDRSAPNGYVCINPAHLCWGTKGDNTVDQHHGNGTACGKPKNENEIRSDVRAYAYDLLKEKTRGVIRLSIKDLKSLIFEEVGSAYFGDSFLEFKKKTEQGEFAFDVLRDMGAKVKYVGEGSTRFVYQFKDNPDIVIKIINWPKGRNPEDKVWSGFKKSHMIDSNKWESDLLIQQRYADVFPRTFEVAKDYTWILSEMVDPVKHYGELFDIMGIDNSIFSSNKRVFNMLFKELIEDCIKIFQDPDSSVRKIIFSSNLLSESSALPTYNFDDDPTKKDDTRRVEKENNQTFSPFYRSYLETIKKIVTNKQNAKILGAMGALKIPPREFSPKNLGISRISKKLVILDASLWEKYIKS